MKPTIEIRKLNPNIAWHDVEHEIGIYHNDQLLIEASDIDYEDSSAQTCIELLLELQQIGAIQLVVDIETEAYWHKIFK